MSLYDRVFDHPCLRDNPPVLVDVGASGGLHPAWRILARYAIGVGFEPDAREAGALGPVARRFRKWILCDQLVTADESASDAELHLTRSPFCSSTLPPDAAGLADYAFADWFAVQEKRRVPATTLLAALRAHGLSRVDWLKCDTQGMDLRIFRSLPEAVRRQALAVEFEPGLISAYVGEDKFHQVLAFMEQEPFWLSRLEVQGSPRVRQAHLQSRLGASLARRYRYLGPVAPGWVNAVYLHRAGRDSDLDLRGHLLLWVFAMELGHPAFASELAEVGARRFGDALWAELVDESERQMRRALWRTWPRWPGLLWQKITRRTA